MKHALLALLAIAAASAAEAQSGSAYYGLSIGEFDYDEGEGSFADSVNSYRLMISYLFNDHLAVEGGYAETNTLRDVQTFVHPVLGPLDVAFESDFKILTVRLLGVLPFDNGISLLGGFGYADAKQDITIDAGVLGQQSGDVDENAPAYYVAAQYDWDRAAVRLGYEKYDFDGGLDVIETSITFFYKL
jgi:hypothetical protein